VRHAELTAFHRSLRNLDYTRKRMEQLYLDGALAKRDIDSAYESLFLRAVTSFETFLEELFLAILERRKRYHHSRHVSLLMTTPSRSALMDILLQGDKYLTWLPFRETKKRAILYLVDGRPFTELDNGEESIVQTITTIRHAIAHKSRHAMREFREKVIGAQALLHGEKSPAGYLRAHVRSGARETRLEVYVSALGLIAVKLDVARLP
jgi:hypothetical protein